MKAVLCDYTSGSGHRRKSSGKGVLSSRTLSPSSLVLFVILVWSKCTLAKDFYYHPNAIFHSDSQQQEGDTILEFISTRSHDAPIATPSISPSTTSSSINLPHSSSRPNEIGEEKQEKAPLPFSTRVECSENEMVVDVLSSSSNTITEAYLQGLKNYPDPSCTPTSKEPNKGHHMQFRLSLSDLSFYRCGTNLIINKITGTRTYYNRLDVVVLEKPEVEQNGNVTEATATDTISPASDDQNYVYNTQTVLIKCQFANQTALSHNRTRRDVLPAGFQEADVLPNQILYKEGRAPDPMLTMRVRQDGRVIGHELLVQPGTPLTMEVAIDDQASREIYGILMSQMDVTDNAAQDEIIMLNGCSVDPYLFENFKTSDSDLLTAQFKAFKFPDSNYVLFRGTVNVCLERCEPTDCSNGQRGYGRRRRDTTSSSQEQDRLYEVQMTTLLRMAKADLSDDSSDMSPYILGSKSHHPHNNNNAIFSLLRKAREQGANQAEPVASINSSISLSPSWGVFLVLCFILLERPWL